MGLLASLLGSWGGVAAADAAQAGGFCQAEFPQMWQKFVDHVVDTAYNKTCTAEQDPEPPELPPLRVPAAKRLVAVGDLHGDMDKAMRAFRLAGLVDDKGIWSGGDTVCVQVGDILDRGDQEIKILFMLERLQRQAEAAGGALYVLNGNHETMNVAGNYRYATAGADLEMAAWKRWRQLGQRLKEACSSCKEDTAAAAAASIDAASVPDATGAVGRGARQFNPLREAALRPGGPITRRFFAPHPVVLQVGSTLFVHGGVLPSHVEYGLENINKETRDWLLGGSDGPTLKRAPPPKFLRGADAVVWAREYSARDESRCDCDTLQQVLESLPGAKRMVVGHTIQDRGINSACDGKVLRVDVGLSKGCGNGDVQVLEITQDGQHIVRLAEGQEPQVVSGQGQQQQQEQKQQQQQQQHQIDQEQPRRLVPAMQPHLASVVERTAQQRRRQQDEHQQWSSRGDILSTAIAKFFAMEYGVSDSSSGSGSSSSSNGGSSGIEPSTAS